MPVATGNDGQRMRLNTGENKRVAASMLASLFPFPTSAETDSSRWIIRPRTVLLIFCYVNARGWILEKSLMHLAMRCEVGLESV